MLLLSIILMMGCGAYYANQFPLHGAAYGGKTQQVQTMITSGASIESRDKYGMTPILAAASTGQWDTVRALLDMGADINAKDSFGFTAFLYAIQWCDLNMVKLLAERGAETNVKTADGTTTISFVVYCSDRPEKTLAMINILLEKGCDISATDNQGHTVYWTAMENMYMNMVSILRKKGVTERYQNGTAGGFDEALRAPSRYTPPAGTYVIPSDQEYKYQLAIEDCNHMVVPYKKGLLLTTGPIGYGIGLIIDQVRIPEKFQKCMEVMGFNCANNCAR